MNKELETIKQKIQENSNLINQTYNKVKRIGIFGSFSRNKQTKKSDVDIVVEFEEPISFFKFIELEDYLSDLLNRKVDLVTKKGLKPAIKARVLKQTQYV